MNLPRRSFLHLVAGGAVLPTVSRTSWAQAYPTRPVRPRAGVRVRRGHDLARVAGWYAFSVGSSPAATAPSMARCKTSGSQLVQRVRC